MNQLAKNEKNEKTVKFDDENENYEDSQIAEYEELTEEQKKK